MDPRSMSVSTRHVDCDAVFSPFGLSQLHFLIPIFQVHKDQGEGFYDLALKFSQPMIYKNLDLSREVW